MALTNNDRPELPSSNRSHKGEDKTDSYFFNDFYGEFSISIKREGEAIEVLEEYSGQRLAAGTDDWMRSVQGLVNARVRG